jgi:hypothetical protein
LRWHRTAVAHLANRRGITHGFAGAGVAAFQTVTYVQLTGSF